MNKEEEAGKAIKIFGLAIIILILDQLSKFFVITNIEDSSIHIINEILHFTFVKNTGAGFGILKGQNTLLIFVAITLIGVMLYYYDKLDKPITYYALGLILGGTIGNLIDRIRLGFVIDFIDFQFWPNFNIADSAISVGAVLLIIYFWKIDSVKA